jgi:hypothetical protein
MNKETKDRIDKWVGERYEWLLGEISTNIAKGKMSQYADDLTIHMIETLYSQPEDKINQMMDEDKVGWWLLVGAGMQLRSSTSPFYRIYRQEKGWSREQGLEGSFNNIFERPDEPYDDSLMECFQKEYKNLHWYLQAIMNKYWFEGQTLTEIHKYYNISKLHLTKDINKAINIIREKCNNC